MAEDVNIPKVGKLPKTVLIPLAVGIVGFVGWRFWSARNGTGDDATSTIEDGEFGAVDSSIPGVVGAVKPGNAYGEDTGGSDSGNDPTRFTNNAQWTDYVVGKLQQSETWSYNDIMTAIGNGLAAKPTTDEQQKILRAAIAIGGNPPSGSIVIVSGGNTALTVAPNGVSVVGTTANTASIGFSPVAGATQYVVYRSGISGNVGVSSASPITVSGLQPNTSYTFQVAALSASGVPGPKSSTVSGKTKSFTLARPSTPSVSGITTTQATVSTGKVANADGYRWYANGVPRGYSEAPTYRMVGLTKGTRYTVTVAADVTKQNPGPQSPGRTFTTKKK